MFLLTVFGTIVLGFSNLIETLNDIIKAQRYSWDDISFNNRIPDSFRPIRNTYILILDLWNL